jgi:hypothetical protein
MHPTSHGERDERRREQIELRGVTVLVARGTAAVEVMTAHGRSREAATTVVGACGSSEEQQAEAGEGRPHRPAAPGELDFGPASVRPRLSLISDT